MIIKSSKIKGSIGKAVQYCSNPDKEANVIYSQGIAFQDDPNLVTKQFALFDMPDYAYDYYHLKVSFSPADEVDDITMRKSASELVKRLNVEKCPVIAYRHHDTEHPHYHMLISRLQQDSLKPIRDGWMQNRLSNIAKELEEEMQLRKTAEIRPREIEKIQECLRASQSLEEFHHRLLSIGYKSKKDERGQAYEKDKFVVNFFELDDQHRDYWHHLLMKPWAEEVHRISQKYKVVEFKEDKNERSTNRHQSRDLYQNR